MCTHSNSREGRRLGTKEIRLAGQAAKEKAEGKPNERDGLVECTYLRVGGGQKQVVGNAV